MVDTHPGALAMEASIAMRLSGGEEAAPMLARAEAACERYLQAASEPGLGTLALRRRRDNWRAMERVVARLRGETSMIIVSGAAE